MLAPPDHQSSHEQRDCDGEHDEGAEDAVGRVLKCSAGDGALAEVEMVDREEEFVHFRVRPETANIVCHILGAVSELPIAPVGGKKKRGCQGPGQWQSSPSPPPKALGPAGKGSR